MSANNQNAKSSRRAFIKQSGVLAAGAVFASLPNVHAAENNTINIALVGCGGRGGGAVMNAMNPANGPTKLVATADVFEDRVVNLTKSLNEELGDRAGVPPERTFRGFDAYKKAIDCLNPGDVVLLASPPVFRPLHVEYAVSKGVNIFMEKPFATDSPGTRRIQAAIKKADEKNIKVACGLMYRHCAAREEAIKRIHDGEIGQITHLRGFRMENAVGPRVRSEKETEVAYQLRNFHYFDWAGGDVYVDYCIHNVDVACWAKGTWPVKALGFGGRSMPTLGGQMFDTWNVEFEFADGTFLSSTCATRNNCTNMYKDFAHGTKGSAVLMESLDQAKTRLYKTQVMTPENLTWAYPGREPNPYDVEHNLLFDAIRNNKPYNEGHRACEANFAILLGRAAINSGKTVTWDDIVKSELKLVDVDTLSFDSEPPVKRNEDGSYPYAIPGQTVAF
ncbi:MAG: Gfo/Idh/MocA family oxidoreductase [Planctomycetaceae bacterium]|jgi:predicted dehydrogenase|nr:Gfo/Idh/MocA family oxidoreductase [Planctomycetaceae bacterium]